jgi:hypothetical protein
MRSDRTNAATPRECKDSRAQRALLYGLSGDLAMPVGDVTVSRRPCSWTSRSRLSGSTSSTGKRLSARSTGCTRGRALATFGGAVVPAGELLACVPRALGVCLPRRGRRYRRVRVARPTPSLMWRPGHADTADTLYRRCSSLDGISDSTSTIFVGLELSI